MKETMGRYFGRLERSFDAHGRGLPRVPFDPDYEPVVWAGPPDDEGWSPWRAVEKTRQHDLRRIAPDLGHLHPSVVEYLNSWWFCEIVGFLDDRGVELVPVPPGPDVDRFVDRARRYRLARGDARHVPIGFDMRDGFLVVVDNATGSVSVEDWEAGTFVRVAAGIEELLDALRIPRDAAVTPET